MIDADAASCTNGCEVRTGCGPQEICDEAWQLWAVWVWPVGKVAPRLRALLPAKVPHVSSTPEVLKCAALLASLRPSELPTSTAGLTERSTLFAPSGARVGMRGCVVVPLPSCPVPLSPQVHRLPSAVTATAKSPPAAMNW